MSRPVYSERFFSVTRSSGASQTEYTVPAGKRAIVSDFTVFDISAGGTGGTVALVGPGGADFWLVGVALGTSAIHLSGLHLVFYAGEAMHTYRVAGTAQVAAHGYLLDDP